MPPVIPKKGEIAFVYYWQEQQSGSGHVVRTKGSPFKSTIVGVDFKEEVIVCLDLETKGLHQHTGRKGKSL
jgi:hypothetical protein